MAVASALLQLGEEQRCLPVDAVLYLQLRPPRHWPPRRYSYLRCAHPTSVLCTSYFAEVRVTSWWGPSSLLRLGFRVSAQDDGHRKNEGLHRFCTSAAGSRQPTGCQ